jgi:Yip1-like protein
MKHLLARVQGLLLDPQGEWAKIDRESGEPAHLFLNYVAILALIPAVAGFIGGSIIGFTVSVGTFRVPMLTGLLNAVIAYLFSFVLVYVVALVIDALAPSFGTQRHFPSALKLSVYSFTPAWLAGIFLLVPGLSFLTILGLYGFYLLWAGLPILMRTPRERALTYAASVTLCALIVTFVLALIESAIEALPRSS